MFTTSSIKGLIAYIVSLDVILFSIAWWVQKTNEVIGDSLATLVTAAGLVISWYTIQKLRMDIRARRLDNIIKEIEIKEKKSKSNEKD